MALQRLIPSSLVEQKALDAAHANRSLSSMLVLIFPERDMTEFKGVLDANAELFDALAGSERSARAQLEEGKSCDEMRTLIAAELRVPGKYIIGTWEEHEEHERARAAYEQREENSMAVADARAADMATRLSRLDPGSEFERVRQGPTRRSHVLIEMNRLDRLVGLAERAPKGSPPAHEARDAGGRDAAEWRYEWPAEATGYTADRRLSLWRGCRGTRGGVRRGCGGRDETRDRDGV